MSRIRLTVASAAAADSPEQPWMEQLLSLMDSLGPACAVAPVALEFPEQLEHALQTAPDEERELAAAVADASPSLQWTMAYTDLAGDPVVDRMLDAYAFAPLVATNGPAPFSAPYESSSLFMGLVLQGADVFYPLHHHPAVEVYRIIGGTAMWQRGEDSPLQARPPGSLFVHDTWEAHACTTAREPTLSWFAWLTELDSPPLFLPGALTG